MSKTIINGSNDFFDVGGKDGDVMYSFTGPCGLTKDNVLCGKTVNLSEMYDIMLDDVREFLFGGEFVSLIDKTKCRERVLQIVNAYTFKKYGITIQWIYNKIQGNLSETTMTVDILYNELKNKYGMMNVDWMYLYNNVNQFKTNDVDILEYVANKILGNDFYNYFVTEYNIRTVGVVKKVYNFIRVEWNNGGSKDIHLSKFVKSYNRWWMMMTGKKDKNRGDIRDYDVLLNGRSVTEVFPVYCPVFSNLRLNYTGIDFDGKNNIRKCSEIAGYSDKGETWSFASIDRIDSSKGYSYDNISIISHYANHLKNVGNIDQMRIWLRYMDEQNSYF
jgi:hypothetical protein